MWSMEKTAGYTVLQEEMRPKLLRPDNKTDFRWNIFSA
jgi:hypothetical protein